MLTAPAKFLAGNFILALVAMFFPTVHEDLKLLPGLQLFPGSQRQLVPMGQDAQLEVLQTSRNLE